MTPEERSAKFLRRNKLTGVLDLIWWNKKFAKEIRQAQREAYERAAEIVIDSPSYFTNKDRLGLAEAIRKEAEKLED